jgi:hypothetical protein
MAFDESTKDAAFKRSHGQCECRWMQCPQSHRGRCTSKVTRQGAHFCHRIALTIGGDDAVTNCEVLCMPCYEGLKSDGLDE